MTRQQTMWAWVDKSDTNSKGIIFVDETKLAVSKMRASVVAKLKAADTPGGKDTQEMRTLCKSSVIQKVTVTYTT